MKTQIAGIFCLLAGVLSVNLFSAPDAAAHEGSHGDHWVPCERFPWSDGGLPGVHYGPNWISEWVHGPTVDGLMTENGYVMVPVNPQTVCRDGVKSTEILTGSDAEPIVVSPECPPHMFSTEDGSCEDLVVQEDCADGDILDPLHNECVPDVTPSAPLTRTPDEVQPATDAEAVQEAAAQLGIAQASYAPAANSACNVTRTPPTPGNPHHGWPSREECEALPDDELGDFHYEWRERCGGYCVRVVGLWNTEGGDAPDPELCPPGDNSILCTGDDEGLRPLTRTPEDVQSGPEVVQNAAAQLGIAQASYAPVQQISPSDENRLPEYAAPAAILGVLAFSSLYPDYELGSSFSYSGENGSLDWETGMHGTFSHGSFSSYVSALQSDSGFEIESGTTYQSDSFRASYTTVEAKDYMNYNVQLSAPWQHRGWEIKPNLSSQFHYDRDENHSSSESGAGLDLEYRF